LGSVTLWSGAPYEYATVAGGFVFAAGACPLDAHGRVVGPGDIEMQAEQIVENLRHALAQEGAGFGDLVKVTIYVVGEKRDDLVRVWNVVSPHLGRVPNTLLGVSLLGYPEQLVEIEEIAVVPEPPAA
jgi:enamine deaminase RidA (YjgF/YER057c/UK114 family)